MSLTFSTENKCPVCSNVVVASWSQAQSIYTHQNNTYGPLIGQFEGPQTKFDGYHCSSCGVPIKPTLTNKLTLVESVHKRADEIFQKTFGVSLNRTLTSHEVLDVSGEMVPEEKLQYFVNGAVLRIYHSDNMLQGHSHLSLDEKKYYLIMMKTKTKLFIDAAEVRQGKKTTLVAGNKKLPAHEFKYVRKKVPKHAIPAVEVVVLSPDFVENTYYIPSDTIGVR